MTRLVPSLALLALCAVSTASCSMLEDTQSAQSTPAASVSAGDPGQAYRSLAAKRSGETNAEERHRAWEAFAAAFKNDYSDRLTQAATDETSKQALAALAVYVERNTALDSGAIPEFADQQGAEEALKRGENPEVNPAYTQALAEATTAHATLTTCMPHWPVVF